jgi:Xaa-Pro dipeptidase
MDLLAHELAKAPTRVLGFDAKSSALSVSSYERLRTVVSDKITLRPTTAVEQLRLIKSDAELNYIRAAAKIATLSMEAGLKAVRPGRTENDVAIEIYRTAIQNGSEHVASQPYVKTGERSWITHGRWEGAAIQSGDLVMIELGACVKRYHAAIMRSAVCGPASPRVRNVADAVVASLARTLEVLRPGVRARDVDQAYRDVITKAGFGRFNRHALGYSIGVAFAPGWGEPEIFMISPTDNRSIEANMTFHLVPSVTIPGEIGHVACSATVLVREAGPEVLTALPRKIWEIAA